MVVVVVLLVLVSVFGKINIGFLHDNTTDSAHPAPRQTETPSLFSAHS